MSSSHLNYCSLLYTPPQSQNGDSIVKESEAGDQVSKTKDFKNYNVKRIKKRQQKAITKLKGEQLEAEERASASKAKNTNIKKEACAKVKLLEK